VECKILEQTVENPRVDVDLDHVQRFPGFQDHDGAGQGDNRRVPGDDVVRHVGADEQAAPVGFDRLLIPALFPVVKSRGKGFVIRSGNGIVETAVTRDDENAVDILPGVADEAHIGIQIPLQVQPFHQGVVLIPGQAPQIVVELVVVIGLHGHLLQLL